MSIHDEIARTREAAQAQTSEADRLAQLAALYPDLRKHTGRWGKVAFSSKAANAQVTDYDSRFNCGCCNDSPYEVWPYLTTPYGKVYSDPPMLFLGERGYDIPLRSHPDWEERLTAHGMNPALIERLRLVMPSPDTPDEPEEETP